MNSYLLSQQRLHKHIAFVCIEQTSYDVFIMGFGSADRQILLLLDKERCLVYSDQSVDIMYLHSECIFTENKQNTTNPIISPDHFAVSFPLPHPL